MVDFFKNLVLDAPVASVALILGIALLAAATVRSFELKGVQLTGRQALVLAMLGGLLAIIGLGAGLASSTEMGVQAAFRPRSTSGGENTLEMKTVPSTVFPFAGGNNPQVQGIGRMSVVYDEEAEPNYVLTYSLPAQPDFTWAGIGIQFDSLNISDYQNLELTIRFSDPQTQCEVKLVDASGDPSYFRLGDSPKANSNVTITVDGDIQSLKIPLRGNFDDVNLEQITEITFITSSSLGNGDHSYTVSRIRFTKD